MTFKDTTYYLAGAIGTEIQRRGFQTDLPLWSAKVLFEKPELLVEIYRDYLSAGANIITTNTFRTQKRTLAKAGLESEWERINRLAVDLAMEAREEAHSKVLIAACATTLEDCYRSDLVPPEKECRAEHKEQIELLAKTPIDLFVLETFNTIGESAIAAQYAAQSGEPFVLSFVPGKDGNILSGENWEDALDRIAPLKPVAILVNCAPPRVATAALAKLAPLAKAHGIPFGIYANGIGESGSDQGWDFSSAGSPIDAYIEAAKAWKALGASIIGGCCGTTPEYTKRYSRI